MCCRTHPIGEGQEQGQGNESNEVLKRLMMPSCATTRALRKKKSPSQSIRQRRLVREGREGRNPTPALSPECCLVLGADPLDVTYILIFMNALIAPLKALPQPGGEYLYKRVKKEQK